MESLSVALEPRNDALRNKWSAASLGFHVTWHFYSLVYNTFTSIEPLLVPNFLTFSQTCKNLEKIEASSSRVRTNQSPSINKLRNNNTLVHIIDNSQPWRMAVLPLLKGSCKSTHTKRMWRGSFTGRLASLATVGNYLRPGILVAG